MARFVSIDESSCVLLRARTSYIGPQEAPGPTKTSSYKRVPDPPHATWAGPIDCCSQLVSIAESSPSTMLSPEKSAEITGDHLSGCLRS